MNTSKFQYRTLSGYDDDDDGDDNDDDDDDDDDDDQLQHNDIYVVQFSVNTKFFSYNGSMKKV